MYLFLASLLTIVIGLVHSVFGERLIFRRWRRDAPLPVRHLRIVWASWHLVTLMGWGLAAVLWWMARQPAGALAGTPLAAAIATTMFASALTVCAATRGRHPGWIGLLVVGLLVVAAPQERGGSSADVQPGQRPMVLQRAGIDAAVERGQRGAQPVVVDHVHHLRRQALQLALQP